MLPITAFLILFITVKLCWREADSYVLKLLLEQKTVLTLTPPLKI